MSPMDPFCLEPWFDGLPSRMNPLLSRFCVALALPVAVLGAPFHLQFEQPTLDRWMYPFNASPGMRPAAPVFATFGDASGVDTRHGQFLMGWDTGDVIPTNHPPRCYIITFARLTLRTLRDGSFLNDSTADSFASYLPADSFLSAPDGDPGRPVELFGAGFRNGFSEETFVESAPFGAASTAGRNAYVAGFNMEGKLVDVSNNVGKTNAAWLPFPTSPFAVGVIGTVPAGEPVPAGSPVRFDLNLKDPLVLRYLKASLSLGRLRLTATWLGESGGFSGTPRYPDFATRENLLYDPPQLEIGGLLVGAGDTDGDQLPDDWERHWFGGLAHSGSEDADGDGQSNQNELDWDTIPADAASVVLIGSLQSLSDGRIRLYFSSGSPGPFRMETASSMGNWVESSGIFNFPEPLRGEWTSDAVPGSPTAFFRLRPE